MGAWSLLSGERLTYCLLFANAHPRRSNASLSVLDLAVYDLPSMFAIALGQRRMLDMLITIAVSKHLCEYTHDAIS